MSFGFSVSNDLGHKVIDENHGLYVVVPARCRPEYYQYYTKTGRNTTTIYEATRTRITFTRPYRGIAPPLIFMRGNGSHPRANSRDWVEDRFASWYNQLYYQLFGGPGNWTGALIQADITWYTFYYSDITSRSRSFYWDLRDNFMVAGTAVDPVAGGYGAVIRDAAGRVVFNSNDNFLEVIDYSNSWDYRGRDRYGDKYAERWRCEGLVVPAGNNTISTPWVSLIPYTRIRRYNGEEAELWPCNMTRGQAPEVTVISGRSGSPFHLPVITVRPKLPIAYTYG